MSHRNVFGLIGGTAFSDMCLRTGCMNLSAGSHI
jgi:hypothetical protein